MKYLNVEEVKALHELGINAYGGSYGVRDEGALEVAVHRPQTGYYNDVIEEAAALLESLAINHPFIDGNKRVAFLATKAFLNINGYEIVADEMEIYQQMIDMFENKNFKFEAVDAMLRQCVEEDKKMNDDSKTKLQEANDKKKEKQKTDILLYLFSKGAGTVEAPNSGLEKETIIKEFKLNPFIFDLIIGELLKDEYVADNGFDFREPEESQFYECPTSFILTKKV